MSSKLTCHKRVLLKTEGGKREDRELGSMNLVVPSNHHADPSVLTHWPENGH